MYAPRIFFGFWFGCNAQSSLLWALNLLLEMPMLKSSPTQLWHYRMYVTKRSAECGKWSLAISGVDKGDWGREKTPQSGDVCAEERESGKIEIWPLSFFSTSLWNGATNAKFPQGVVALFFLHIGYFVAVYVILILASHIWSLGVFFDSLVVRVIGSPFFGHE